MKDEERKVRRYYCIVLEEIATEIPIQYTGLESYVIDLTKENIPAEEYYRKKMLSVIMLLNYLLYNTDITDLADLDIGQFRQYLQSIKGVADRTRTTDGWNRIKDNTIAFLITYQTHRKAMYTLDARMLRTSEWVKIGNTRKKLLVNKTASLGVAPPKPSTRVKNRVLGQGHLEVLMREAQKHDPELVLMIALGAYAGLREGELVNMRIGSISIKRMLGSISKIEIDLLQDAEWTKNRKGKCDPGRIKVVRIQEVYADFLYDINRLYLEHIARHDRLAWKLGDEITGMDAPLFIDKYGKPMTVSTYARRLKLLFYDHFLPRLKQICMESGQYDENIAFIEAYEYQYPGAHMLRHWYTMYLITVARLDRAQVSKWRGDKDPNSLETYIHENGAFIEAFEKSTKRFQEEILGSIYDNH